MLDLGNNSGLPSLTSQGQAPDSFTNQVTETPLRDVCGQQSMLFPHPCPVEEMKTTNTEKKKRKGGWGRTAHNQAQLAWTVDEIISEEENIWKYVRQGYILGRKLNPKHSLLHWRTHLISQVCEILCIFQHSVKIWQFYMVLISGCLHMKSSINTLI